MKSQFYPDQDDDGQWVIGCVNDGVECIIGNSDDTGLVFGSKRDVEISIRSLTENGIVSPDALLNGDQRQVKKIICESLLW